MLTALLIIGSLLFIILILFLMLLCFPAILQVNLQNTQLILTLRIFGIPIRVYPKKSKPIKYKKNKASSKETNAKRPSVLQSLTDEDPQTVLAYAKELFEEITSFTKGCTAKVHQFTVVAPPVEDAALAAICHTAISGGAAAILELLDQNTHLVICSPTAMDIRPNFTNEKASVALYATLIFPPYRALLSLARLTERLQNI